MQSRQLQLRHAIVIVAEVPFLSKFTRKPATKNNLFPFYPFLKSVLPPYIVVSLWSIRSSPSLSLSLATRLRANYTGERKRRDGREDERLRRTAKTRYQATHVTVSIAHYLRSIEQTATLLPLVSRLHAHRPPPPRA